MTLHKLEDCLILNRDMMPISMLPVETASWREAIKMVYTEAAQIVHEYEDWEVHSPSITMPVPSVIMVREYVHFEHAVAWNEDYLYLRDEYRCQYCLREFPAQQLTQDHVVPRKYGGQTNWTNIASACGPCNHRRGHNTKIKPHKAPYKPSYYELVGKAKKLPLVIPDESWMPYLQWPEENLIVKGNRKKILHMRLAA